MLLNSFILKVKELVTKSTLPQIKSRKQHIKKDKDNKMPDIERTEEQNRRSYLQKYADDRSQLNSSQRRDLESELTERISSSNII